MVSLDEAKWLDLTIDGATKFDGILNLIKGGGGAASAGKIVATASDQMIVIADASKQVENPGRLSPAARGHPFGWQTTKTPSRKPWSGLMSWARSTTLR